MHALSPQSVLPPLLLARTRFPLRTPGKVPADARDCGAPGSNFAPPAHRDRRDLVSRAGWEIGPKSGAILPMRPKFPDLARVLQNVSPIQMGGAWIEIDDRLAGENMPPEAALPLDKPESRRVGPATGSPSTPSSSRSGIRQRTARFGRRISRTARRGRSGGFARSAPTTNGRPRPTTGPRARAGARSARGGPRR